MASGSFFPIWISGKTRRGRDLLHAHTMILDLLQEAQDKIEVRNFFSTFGVSQSYFKSLFGVGVQEYFETIGKRVQMDDPGSDREDDAHSSEEEALAAAGKERVPWRQWPRCSRGPRCVSANCSNDQTEPPQVVLDGAGRPICKNCQEHGISSEECAVESNAVVQGLWFVKYRRTIVPMLVCSNCGYGRPQSPDPQWHNGLPDVNAGWSCIREQPTFVCSRCSSAPIPKERMEDEIPIEHFGPGSERDHESSLSGTPLWQLKANESESTVQSPDEGMPFPGWEITSDEQVIFHDRVCLYFNRYLGKYFVFDQKTHQYIEQIQPPRLPIEHSVTSCVELQNGACFSKSTAGQGDTLTINRCAVVKDLRKCGDLLKSPVPHLDRGLLIILAAGLRGSATAEFVTKVLPPRILAELSAQRGHWSNEHLHMLLTQQFQSLDEEWLKKDGDMPFDGCSLGVVIQLGNCIHVATLGAVHAVADHSDGSLSRRLTEVHETTNIEEHRCLAVAGGRVDERGMVRPGWDMAISSSDATSAFDTLCNIERVMHAPHAFAVLGLSWPLQLEGTSYDCLDVNFVHSAYRKQAVRVHPDKVPTDLTDLAKKAFERLSVNSQNLEEMLQQHGSTAVTKLCQLLTAASDEDALGVESGANQLLVLSAASRLRGQISCLGDSVEAQLGLSKLKGIEEHLAETAPPANLRPISVTRAIGIKDLKRPLALLNAQPSLATIEVPCGTLLLALLSPPIADSAALHELEMFQGRPRASILALRQVQLQSAPSTSCSALILRVNNRQPMESIEDTSEPQLKKRKLARESDRDRDTPSTARVRHILLRHRGTTDSSNHTRHGGRASKSRQPATRSREDAELLGLQLLRQLLAPGGSSLFPTLASKHSECSSSLKAAHLAGDCGWVSRQEKVSAIASAPPRTKSILGSVVTSSQHVGGNLLMQGSGPSNHPEEFVLASLALDIMELSDLVSTERGIHIIQRLA